MPSSGIRRVATVSPMRRGEVYLVDFEPVRGSEASKTRPAVIVSNDAANRAAERSARGVLTVVPITSSVDRVFPFQVLLDAGECGLSKDSKAQAEQVRAVAATRLVRRLGALRPATLGRLDDALRTHLAL
jgi:mRNA interferase MazF